MYVHCSVPLLEDPSYYLGVPLHVLQPRYPLLGVWEPPLLLVYDHHQALGLPLCPLLQYFQLLSFLLTRKAKTVFYIQGPNRNQQTEMNNTFQAAAAAADTELST